MIGQKFGNLTIVSFFGIKQKRKHWNCKCDCGNVSVVSTTNLKRGNSKRCSNSCVLIQRYNYQDLSDKRFGHLLVVSKSESKTKNRGVLWLCLCDCGKELLIPSNSLTSGNTKSCGCKQYLIEKHKDLIPSSYINTIKQNAIKRNIEYTVSEDYLYSLFNGYCKISGLPIKFQENKYQRDKTKRGTASLDRIDSSKGYIEGNVQWTHKVVNIMKNNQSDTEFIDLCHTISKFNQ